MSSVNNTVAVVDYEMGNLRSVSQAVMTAAQGTDVRVIVTQDPAEVRAASRIVLPGQGAMRDCMAALQASDLRKPCLKPLPPSRSLACAWACRCCWTTAKRAIHRRWA